MEKFSQFKELVNTMNAQGYNWHKEIHDIEQAQEKRKNSVAFSLSDHIKAMVYAMLSSNRPWEGIARNSEKINEFFHDFDSSYLMAASPNDLIRQLTDIKCGNRQLKNQMLNLKDNINTLQRISSDYGTIDNYYNSTDIDALIKSLSVPGQKYKLKYMGTPLICEYLKGVGLDIIKPDVHVCRIIGRLGYSKHNPATEQEAIDVCREIAREYDLSLAAVDTIFWQYGANDKFMLCGSTPACDSCGANQCPSRRMQNDQSNR